MQTQLKTPEPAIKFRNLHRCLTTPRRFFTKKTITMKKGELNEVTKTAKSLRKKAIKKDERLIAFKIWFDELRKRLNVSDTEFAQMVGVSRETIRNIKLDYGHIPSNTTIKKLEKLDRMSKIVVKISKKEK